MIDFDQAGKTQTFEWGSILWFVEPDDLDVERLSVGLVTFHPYAVHEEHLHGGDEQVLYVVAGRGVHIVDGRASPARQGDIKYIPPFHRHKVVNDTADELKFIIVYTPTKFQRLLARAEETAPARRDADLRSFLDFQVIRALLNKLAKALGLSLALMDTSGAFLLKTDHYPPFCSLLETASGGCHCRRRMRRAMREIAPVHKAHPFYCCSEIVSVMIPILNDHAVIGYVKCGAVFLNRPDEAALRGFVDGLAAAWPRLEPARALQAALRVGVEPKNRLYTAAEATFAIANCIAEMTGAALRQKELDSSRLSLAKERVAAAELEKSLQAADFRLLQSRLNPHFLFNTLNTIAQMAYIEGAGRAAELVWSLSDLLRFTLRRTEELVSLAEELATLETYLAIQQARFGDRLRVEWAVEDGLGTIPVPCLLLQPLVENAIVHGFETNPRRGVIEISIWKRGGDLHFRIADNGVGFDARQAGGEHGGIGLRSVRDRLRYYFQERFQFTIDSRRGEGTVVKLWFRTSGGEADGR